MEALAAAIVFAPLALSSGAGDVAASLGETTRKIIRRQDDEAGWPFTIDEGQLSCFRFHSQDHVFFSEPWPDYDLDKMSFPYIPRSIAVSTNPMVLVFVNIEDRALFKPFASLEELIRRIAPYETAGRKLCDEAPGATP